MPIKNDRWIRQMAREHGMIEPFVAEQVRGGSISYGLSSYGYDMRIANEFKVFTNVFNTLVDPKQFDPRSFVDVRGDYCDIPPNSFALARSVEYFRISHFTEERGSGRRSISERVKTLVYRAQGIFPCPVTILEG